MAEYLSVSSYKQFIASAKSLCRDTDAISCTRRKYKIPGIDLDAFHRHHRLAAKWGLLETEETHDSILYTLTPRGHAVLDNYLMFTDKA